MAHYIRLFTKCSDHVPLNQIVANLVDDGLPRIEFEIEEGNSSEWTQILVLNGAGDGICDIERNEWGYDELFDEEVKEFVEFLGDSLPRSGADWVVSYLSEAKAVYAFRFLEAGSLANESEVAPHNILWAIKRSVGGIVQADNEGFSNEDGYQVTYEFESLVSFPWTCAVLNKNGKWIAFDMDLGNEVHVVSFKEGNVPPGVRIVE